MKILPLALSTFFAACTVVLPPRPPATPPAPKGKACPSGQQPDSHGICRPWP